MYFSSFLHNTNGREGEAPRLLACRDNVRRRKGVNTKLPLATQLDLCDECTRPHTRICERAPAADSQRIPSTEPGAKPQILALCMSPAVVVAAAKHDF